MEEPGHQHGSEREECLLRLLVETAQGLGEMVRGRDLQEGKGSKATRLNNREEGEGGGQEEGREEEEWVRENRMNHGEVHREREAQHRLLRLLRELGEMHRQRITAWREALRVSACALSLTPSVGHTLTTVEDDLKSIEDGLHNIRTKLNMEIIRPCAEEGWTTEKETHKALQGDVQCQETSDSQPSQSDSKTQQDNHNASDSHDPPGFDPGPSHTVCADDGASPSHTEGVSETCAACHNHSSSDSQDDAGSSPSSSQSNCSGAESRPLVGEAQQGSGADMEGSVVCVGEEETDNCKDICPVTQTEISDGDGTEEKGGESAWATLGLTGRSVDGPTDVPDACIVFAPMGLAGVMTCDVADALSSLMVTGSEELVSRVLRVKVQDGAKCPFPIKVAVPFRACYRGNYRDVVVKVVDEERRVSYISPVSTEGTYGGHRGSFAEVRVYSLGLFAVLSCLRRETYTVPRRGLSLKLSMDPRVCLDYLPGSFTAPVVAQSMIQPVDATLLATLKFRGDDYHSVLSTSPLLYLTHPSSQTLRRPLTLTLPCPPNPDKRRAGHGEDPDHHARPTSVAPTQDKPNLHRVRAMSASVKSSRESSNELMVLLGWREEQWSVQEKVTVRNLQNGLVSFELSENFERLMVVRLLSSTRHSHLTALVEEVEDSVRRTMVTVVLQQRREEPNAVLVAALPSRDLSWELSKLQAQGYCGPPEPSTEILMCEGEQLLLSFHGNITSIGTQNNQNGAVCERITFHNQRKNRLHLHLMEVDPFGNYSSPHYKGTVIFHKVARSQLVWRGDEAATSSPGMLQDPVCKLSLTLPKKMRTISRPVSAKVMSHDQSESLSDPLLSWLSKELCEEDMALLVLSLRLRRSSIQLVRLQAPDSLAAQAFHILALWRRGLPAGPHPARASQLAQCLAKSGRPDLAKELLLRQAATRVSLEDGDKEE